VIQLYEGGDVKEKKHGDGERSDKVEKAVGSHRLRRSYQGKRGLTSREARPMVWSKQGGHELKIRGNGLPTKGRI